MMFHPYSVVSALTPAGEPSLEMLADAMSSETKLIDELIAIMRRQRMAVAADDLEAVDASVFATHRVLITLNEARRRRRTLNHMLGEREDISIDALEDMLGSRMTLQLSGLRDSLRQAAHSLSHEVSVNRRVLRQALAGGDAYVRTLTGAPTAITYASHTAAPDPINEGVLINRRA
jgi:hypothetical protein